MITNIIIRKVLVASCLLLASCAPSVTVPGRIESYINPAEEFSKASHSGEAQDFSIYKVASKDSALGNTIQQPPSPVPEELVHRVGGDPDWLRENKYKQDGYNYKGSLSAPKTIPDNMLTHAAPVMANTPQAQPQQYAVHPDTPMYPAGSMAPYHRGQMTANPSLWPGDNTANTLFRDFRAFQAMDVITITVNESQEGKKKAETDTENEFTLTAGIAELFGIETDKWAANNTSLDPATLINATTKSEFTGTGETQRSGTLKGTISAIIMEVLPNGLLRVEGTKILSVNAEEEIMVVSGLVRQRDVDARNQVQSSRIANMRIDFYGRGVAAEQQTPGWGARFIRWVWPF